METDYLIVDGRFRELILNPISVHVERLWGEGRWTEGPAYFPAHRSVVWSDIPNNRMMRWTETGNIDVFRAPSNYTNGNTVDDQGRLVSCVHGKRCVTRTEHDGSITVIADSYQGKRLNSPNDVVVKSDGSIWFTDPSYGILSDYEGHRAEPELDRCYVFRCDPSGKLEIVADNFVKPNGLAFSPDEKILYIADTGRSHDPNGPAHIRKFAVGDDNRLSGGEVFAAPDVGFSDGFRVDEHGNIWTSAGDGVHCFNPQGELYGKILIPEIVANVCFGGLARNRLFITATTSLYSVYLAVRGVCR